MIELGIFLSKKNVHSKAGNQNRDHFISNQELYPLNQEAYFLTNILPSSHFQGIFRKKSFNIPVYYLSWIIFIFRNKCVYPPLWFSSFFEAKCLSSVMILPISRKQIVYPSIDFTE